MNDTGSAAALRRPETRAPARAGWPSLLVAALVFAAAIYSFSPRPAPDFPATQVHADRLLVNGLARRDNRLVAAGEQGQILVADGVQGPWRSAAITPQRGSTFTQLLLVDETLALAVGHDGWIVRSTDSGQSWAEVHYGGDGSDPLLGVAGPYGGRLFAFGAFGLMLVSDDAGQTWSPRSVAPAAAAASADPFAAAGEAAAAGAAAADETDPYADPFAGFDAAAVGGSGHLNAMVQAADGALVLVGERGLIKRSTDNGETWADRPQIYTGSLFGVLRTPADTLIAYGMRGHAFRSTDHGLSWSQAEVPTTASLFGGIAPAPDRVVLGGAGNTVVVSSDDGRSFELVSVSARNTIADLLPLPGGWLTAGDDGLLLRERPDQLAQGELP